MLTPEIAPDLRRWIVEQARRGQPPEAVLQPLLANGWPQQQAMDAVEAVVREFLTDHARANALPEPSRVPAPVGLNGPSLVRARDREVHVLANLLHPRIVVLGGLLTHQECDALVRLARPRLARSAVVNTNTGADEIHVGRTSEGTFFERGANPLCLLIERRIAALTEWPFENGEGLQVVRYGPGAEYQPHHDYFDPAQPGSARQLARGGQRVASIVMYLNTPRRGGATVFPEPKLEVAAIKGNAVFFSYDRPHAMTRTLHGGAPVLEGEKCIATKWLRERAHV